MKKNKAVPKKVCATCSKKRCVSKMIRPPGSLRYACKPAISQVCVAALYLSIMDRQKAKKKQEYNKKTREMKRSIESRLDLYKKLGSLVNQYAKHVIYKGEHCYTCGKQQSATDNPGAFHSGHYVPAKRVDPRRFMLENIRIQCYSCNCMLSGNLAEYKKRLGREIGPEKLDWLECEVNHKPLKEQYPNIDDIRDEIGRYRQLLKQHGIRPTV